MPFHSIHLFPPIVSPTWSSEAHQSLTISETLKLNFSNLTLFATKNFFTLHENVQIYISTRFWYTRNKLEINL